MVVNKTRVHALESVGHLRQFYDGKGRVDVMPPYWKDIEVVMVNTHSVIVNTRKLPLLE